MDKDYYLNVAISKALSISEAPLKMKHARSVIIATHRTKSVKPFWAIVTRQPLMENRFTAWKFCHILHKVLREGHENAIKQSQTHKTLILEVGKLWGHLQDGVGKCIELYTKLLVNKLEFHQKNACFPGSLALDFNEVVKMAGNDYNIYFQLCVEVFDYLDHIIDVETQIFLTINTYRMSSMTPQGQCRLAPLITLIQDSNPLYDICVRLMFRLHDGLPHDVLLGHRNRFNEIFSKLKLFYENVRPLQYFSDVIQLPHLPENAPNFSSEVDLGNYTAPVMVLQQEPEPEPTIENLVDVANTTANSPSVENMLYEKDVIIAKLQDECHEKQMELERYLDLTNVVRNLQMKNEAIEREMAMTKDILQNTILIKDNLEQKLGEMSSLEGEVKEGDEKVKHVEEKFDKIKTMYTKLREEHISLLRMRNEDSKQLVYEKNENQQLKTEMESLKEKLEQYTKTDEINLDLKTKIKACEITIADQNSSIEKLNEELNKSRGEQENLIKTSSEEAKQLVNEKNDNQLLKTELEQLKKKLDTFLKIEEINLDLENRIKENDHSIADKALSIEKLTAELSQCREEHESLLKSSNENFQQLLSEKNENQQLITEMESLKEKLNHYLEIEELNSGLKTKIKECEDIIANKDISIEKLNSDLNQTKLQMEENNKEKTSEIRKYENQISQHLLESEQIKESQEKDLQEKLEQINNLLQQNSDKEIAIENLNSKINTICDEKSIIEIGLKETSEKLNHLKKLEIESNVAFNSIIKSLINSLKRDFTFKSFEANLVTESAEINVETIKTQLKRIQEEYTICFANKYRNEGFMVSCVELFSTLKTQHEYITLIFQNTTDMEKAQAIPNTCNDINESLLKLYDMLLSNSNPTNIETICNTVIVGKLNELKSLLSLLRNSFKENLNIGDLLQQELKEMDDIIEEAARRMLEIQSNSKSKNEGIKLEVNEKILDSCTNLMQTIINLIRKSRALQEEIIAHGKGSFTEKEFYKRNSQWTEGLISASKMVAKGANFLVDVANKAIVLESNEFFEIIVAAQEIAASTAQLVIASKVKASKDSQKLIDLTKASRDVSLATGLVVATVKDGSNKLEYKNEIDTTKLTTSQKKAMEMEMHIKVLQLEQALDNERQNLMSFRKKFYQSADDD